MDINHSQIQDLLEHRGEGLNVEIKSWISADDPNGIAKIAKGMLALRNRNGGYLIIGFNDKSLKPDVSNRPSDARGAFHVDKIQGLISRYSWELFEIGVAFPQLDGREYPVIVVPEGVRTPVAAKADLIDRGGKYLIRVGDVYFRTLAANGTPSTALARPQDWREIVEICFENREADVGRFLRRQLAGRDVATLAAALKSLGFVSSDVSVQTATEPSLRDRSTLLLREGEDRFKQALSARKLTRDEKSVTDAGSWEVALVIDPLRTEARPDQVFLSTIAASNPRLTGWPVWLDARGFTDDTARPRVSDNAWEALIISLASWSKHVDFFRLDPKGKFYLWRNLPDDVQDGIKPGILLDPIIAILRVAEAIVVGLSIVKALTSEAETTRLGFAFRWRKLKGRRLEPWANPIVTITSFDAAHDDQVTTYVETTLDTPSSAIAPLVDQATQELFVLFGGYQLPLASIETWVQKLLERKLP
jgi:hypothetical protein